MLKKITPAPAACSDWSFNSRTRTTRNYDDSDSDSSDSNTKGEPSSEPISEEAQLFKDLDLSVREEAVEYKPNPWNIAKINAASRPPRHNFSVPNNVIDDTNTAEKKPKKVPKGRIVDSFRKQAARPAVAGPALKPGAPIGVAEKPRPPAAASVPLMNTKSDSDPKLSTSNLVARSTAVLNVAARNSMYSLSAAASVSRDAPTSHHIVHHSLVQHVPHPAQAPQLVSSQAFVPINRNSVHPSLNIPFPLQTVALNQQPHFFSQSFSSPPAHIKRRGHQRIYARSSPVRPSNEFCAFIPKSTFPSGNGWKRQDEDPDAYMHPNSARSASYFQNDAESDDNDNSPVTTGAKL